MKKFLLTAFLVCGFAWLAPAQAQAGYTNNGAVTSPILIDATNFINNGTFEFSISSLQPFDFLDVLMFTNRGTMYCNNGFLFDNETQDEFGALTHAPANIFGNANTGQIYAGLSGNTPATFYANLQAYGGFFPPTEILIDATNVVNTGVLDVDVTGIIEITGTTVNLSRGSIHVEGFDTFAGTDLLAGITNDPGIGMIDNLQGIGRQSNALSFFNFTLPGAGAPLSNATNTVGAAGVVSVIPTNPTPFVLERQINASNVTHQVVLINTNLPGILTRVRYQQSGVGLSTPVIEWSAVATNITGQLVTNLLYLSDTFGSNPTNNLVTNSFTFSGVPLLAPYNYTFAKTFPNFDLLTPGDPGYDPFSIFAAAFGETNFYSLYEVNLQPTAFQPDPTSVIATFTNLPGRIKITAENDNSSLDLTRAKISGANYLAVNATNHFIGSTNAQIATPIMDINLGSTNGQLAVSSLVAPSIPRITGIIDMYSARWTNVNNSFTNEYHVLFVSVNIAPASPVSVQNLVLRSTNVSLSDLVNVAQNLSITATNFTVTTNDPLSLIPSGILNLQNSNIVWSDSVPFLLNFTNFGTVEANPPLDLPPSLNFQNHDGSSYGTFVNHGSIFAGGVTVFATNFENSGPNAFIQPPTNNIFANLLPSGPFGVTASNAVFIGGGVLMPSGIISPTADIALTLGNLFASNSLIACSGNLSLSVSGAVNDGDGTSSNLWIANDGINLTQKPGTGDFLNTSVALSAPAGLEVLNTWAGTDRGRSPSGFANNGALGQLLLTGGDTASAFFFGGLDNVPTNHYAIYVDQIVLQAGATNRTSQNGAQIFTAFDVAPNMTVYFADAVIGSFDISEKMNGANGGKLIWVPSYAGRFSGISNVLADNQGHTIFANRALVQSVDIDSDGDGTFNAFDNIPLFSAFSLNSGTNKLSVTITNLPPKVPVIQWPTLLNSTNILYFLTNFTSTNPVVVTNFVATAGNSNFNAVTRTARVIDRGRTNAAGFYRVQVNPAQP